MVDWNDVVLRALIELGADNTFTRGAVLTQKVREIGMLEGEDLHAFLQDSGQKFGEFLDANENVLVHRSHGTDMFVGLPDAIWPTRESGEADHGQKRRTRLRADVYEALTIVSDRPYHYVRSSDTFTQDPSGTDSADDLVEMPSVTLMSLIEDRRAFLDRLPSEEVRADLLRAIDHSPNPLSEFQLSVSRHKLARAWHQFKLDRLTRRLNEWAQQNGVPVSPSWVTQPNDQETHQSPQAILSRFAVYMTADEVRLLSVPFRAVEKMYQDLSRNTST